MELLFQCFARELKTFDAWTRVAKRIDRVRVLGSSVLEGCLVADGAIDAFCDPGGDIHRIVDLAALDIHHSCCRRSVD